MFEAPERFTSDVLLPAVWDILSGEQAGHRTQTSTKEPSTRQAFGVELEALLQLDGRLPNGNDQWCNLPREDFGWAGAVGEVTSGSGSATTGV